MSQDNNTKVLLFTLVMTVVASLAIASFQVGFKSRHDLNEAVFNKRAILSSLESLLDKPVKDFSDEEVNHLFENSIDQDIVDHQGNAVKGEALEVDMKKEYEKPNLADRKLPLLIYNSPKGKTYVTSVRGKGLWDAIWGNIALKSDLETIAGVSFDHVGETPGLGAEIKDSPPFGTAFKGKKIYDEQGNFKGVTVSKVPNKSGAEAYHDIDAISGATVTSNGVSDMMKNGLEFYLPYFKNVK